VYRCSPRLTFSAQGSRNARFSLRHVTFGGKGSSIDLLARGLSRQGEMGGGCDEPADDYIGIISMP